jgi:hypothetical protein
MKPAKFNGHIKAKIEKPGMAVSMPKSGKKPKKACQY